MKKTTLFVVALALATGLFSFEGKIEAQRRVQILPRSNQRVQIQQVQPRNNQGDRMRQSQDAVGDACEAAYGSYINARDQYNARRAICDQWRAAVQRKDSDLACRRTLSEIAFRTAEAARERDGSHVVSQCEGFISSAINNLQVENTADREIARLQGECIDPGRTPLVSDAVDRAYGTTVGTSLALEVLERNMYQQEQQTCRACVDRDNHWPHDELGFEVRHCPAQ